MPTSEQVQGLLRTFLAFAGGYVPAAVMSGDDYSQIAGAAVAFAVAAWSWYAKKAPVTPPAA